VTLPGFADTNLCSGYRDKMRFMPEMAKELSLELQ
jgi:hypothetical protein